MTATSPSGNSATILSLPPTASTYDRRLETYMSARCSSLETAGWFTLSDLARSLLSQRSRPTQLVQRHLCKQFSLDRLNSPPPFWTEAFC